MSKFSDLLNQELPSKRSGFDDALFGEAADDGMGDFGSDEKDFEKELDSAAEEGSDKMDDALADDDEIIESMVLDLIYASNSDAYMEAGARFSVIPSFKPIKEKYPELAKYESLMEEVDSVLSKKGEDSPRTFLRKIAEVALKVLGVLQSVGSVILIPFCIFITPIFSLLLTRLWKVAFEAGNLALAKDTTEKSISKLKAIEKKTSDPKAKKKITDLIKKCEDLNKKQKVLDNKEYNLFTGKDKETVKENANEFLEAVFDDSLYDDVFTEGGARFSFLPSFTKLTKKYPELGEYKSLIKEADELLKENGKSKATTFPSKLANVMLRLFGALHTVDSILMLPFCIFILPIVDLGFTRLWKFAADAGSLAIAKNTTEKAISQIESLKEKTDDPKVKEKAESMLKKLKELQKKQKVLENKDYSVISGELKHTKEGAEDLLTDPEEMDGLTDNEIDDDEMNDEELEREVSDADIEDIAGIDDLDEEDLTPEEEMEANNLMQLAATTTLINNEMNPEERVAFAESDIDAITAVNEGFLLESDIEEFESYAHPFTEGKVWTKTKVQFNKDARMAQLHAVAVNVCAQSKNDPDYIKLKKLNRMRKVLRARLNKKYGAAANRLTRVYFQRLKQSKSPALQQIAKKNERAVKEATEIESAGANGASRRFFGEREKFFKKQLDREVKREDQYKKAGYGDKFDPSIKDQLTKRIKNLKDWSDSAETRPGKTDADLKTRQDRAKLSKNDIATYYASRHNKDEKNEKKAELHNRINNRVK